MVLLSGVSAYGGAGGSDVTVNMETNNLLLTSMSFRDIICDTVGGEKVLAKKIDASAVRALGVTTSETFMDVAEEVMRCRRIVDAFDPTTLPWNPGMFSLQGSLVKTLRLTGGVQTFWADNLKGTLVDGAQPSITEIGDLNSLNVNGPTTISSSLSVSGTASVATLSASGTASASNLSVTGLSTLGATSVTTLTGTSLSATTVSCGTLTGTLSTALQTNVTRVGTLTQLTVSGNTSLGVATSTGLTATLAGTLTGNNQTVRLGTSSTDDWDTLRLSGKGGSTTSFAGVAALDGVVLYGKSGGILGGNFLGTSSSERCALRWYASGTNAAVGINTTGTVRGVFETNGDAYVNGRMWCAGAITNSTNLPQGLTATWNFSGGTGETNFINKSGTGGGGFRWYNSTGDGSAFSTGQELMGSLVPSDGLTITNYVRSRKVFCRVNTTNANFTPTTNLIPLWDNANSSGGTTVVADLRPASFNLGGMTGGSYRCHVAGYWRVTVTARLQDGAGGTKGVILRKWNGSTVTNLIPLSDGTYFASDDGAGRRMVTVSAIAQVAALEVVYATLFAVNHNCSWATLEVEMLSEL